MEIYGKSIKMHGFIYKFDGKWLGNDWGVSNLCAPSRGIPGRGVCFSQKSALFIKKGFLMFLYKTSLFMRKQKRPDPLEFENQLITLLKHQTLTSRTVVLLQEKMAMTSMLTVIC